MLPREEMAIFWLAFAIPTYLVCGGLYLLRRRRYPIAAQWPVFNYVSIPFCLAISVLLSARRLLADSPLLPGALYDLLVLTCATTISLVTVMRSWKLYSSYYLKYRLLETQTETHGSRNGAWWQAQTWDRLPLLMKTGHFLFNRGLAVSSVLLVVGCWIAVPIADKDWMTAIGYDSRSSIASNCLLAMFGITTISLIFFAVLVRRVSPRSDSLNITRQLKYAGIGTFIMGAVWAVSVMFDSVQDYCETTLRFDLGLMGSQLMWLVGFGCIVVWPLIDSYRYQFTKWSMSPTAQGGNPRDELQQLLNNPEGRERFRVFLQGEFSVENMLFWEAVEGYRIELLTGGSGKRINPKTLAQRLYNTFVNKNALYEVNLPHPTVMEIRKRLNLLEVTESLSSLFADKIPGKSQSAQSLDQISSPSMSDSRPVTITSTATLLDAQRENSGINSSQISLQKHENAQNTESASCSALTVPQVHLGHSSSREDNGKSEEDISKVREIRDKLKQKREETANVNREMAGIFDEAQAHIFELMATDSFPRFLHSFSNEKNA